MAGHAQHRTWIVPGREARARLTRYLVQAEFPYRVTIEPYDTRAKGAKQRQLGLYWGAWLPIIGQDTGEDNPDRLHSLLKQMFADRQVYEVMGTTIVEPESLSAMSVDARSTFLNKVSAWYATEFGGHLPHGRLEETGQP